MDSRNINIMFIISYIFSIIINTILITHLSKSYFVTNTGIFNSVVPISRSSIEI